MSKEKEKIAFVIMPYGKKKDAEGQEIDFDQVYEEVIKEPLEDAGFKPLRCDEIKGAGMIHEDMFKHIAGDDVAVVDVTIFNPNVFYELGVRHALKPSVTILIKRQGAPFPFNIQGLRVIEYPAPIGNRAARKAIEEFIKSGLESSEPDSPIFNLLQDVRRDPKKERIPKQQRYTFRLAAQPNKRIYVVTGDIREYKGIDVWVNSENTHMQMSRFFDKSLSATIRYEGAEKDEDGEIAADTIGDELAAKMKGKYSVTPGTVITTGPGALAQTRGVKKIFHAASVCGVPGSGYQCMKDVELCVTNALRKIDQPQLAGEPLRSIVFPMMGTGAGGMEVEELAPRLIQKALTYLVNTPESRVEEVYFSAWSYADLDACLRALKASSEVEPVA